MWSNQWARNGFIRPVVQASAIPPSGKQIGFSDRLIPANDELALFLICFDQVFRTHDVTVTPFRRNGVDELIHMDVNAVVVEDSEPFEYAHTEIAAPIRILGAIQAILHSQDGLYFQPVTTAGEQPLCKFGARVFLCELFADGNHNIGVDAVLLRNLPHRQASRAICKNSLPCFGVSPSVFGSLHRFTTGLYKYV